MEWLPHLLADICSFGVWCTIVFRSARALSPKIRAMALSPFARGMIVGSAVVAVPVLFVLAGTHGDDESKFAFYVYAIAFTSVGIIGRATLDAGDPAPDAAELSSGD